MLERAPGCLEHPLRRLFREPRNCLRSRRMLHSAFWSQGVGEIDPVSCWSLFLSTARGSSVQDANTKAKRSSSHNSSEWPFLEFLYPSQTLAFLQRCSSYSIHALLNRRQKMVSKRGSRTYTSTSEGTNESKEGISDLSEAELPPESFDDAADSPAAQLKQMLCVCGQTPADFDEVWEAFNRLERQERYTLRLIAFLSYSSRQVDYKRAFTLVTAIPAKKRHRIRFSGHLEAFSRFGDVDTASARFFKTFAAVEKSLSSTIILSSLINREEWSFAAQLLKAHEAETTGRINWTDVSGLPRFLDRLEDLLRYLEDQAGTIESSSIQDMQTLASRLALKLFQHKKNMWSVSQSRITRILKALRNNHVLSRTHYTFAILSLLAVNREIGIVDDLYGDMSENLDLGRPPKSVLGGMLRAFCDVRSNWGINRIIKDFERFYGGPDEQAYQLLMTTYARLGDDGKVSRLFDEYCSRFGKPTNLDFLTPLIYVHARVGNVQKTLGQFDRIQEEFNVKPNVYCWNMLIMAHARVGDLEGAFEKYKDLLDQGVEPDAHTYGTLMGMLANRGDTEGVQYLLELAISRKVKLAAPLIDAQVEALCHNGEVYEALEVLKSAVDLKLVGSKTRMWNILLCTFASQKNVSRVWDTQRLMRKFKIPFDDMTYAALMGSFTRIGRTDAALQVLTQVLPRAGFLPKPFHYALALHGYAQEGNRDMVTVIYHKVLEVFNKANFSANLAFLVTAIKRDLENLESTPSGSKSFELPHAERFLQSTLDTLGIDTLASKEPRPGTSRQSLLEAYPSAYFEPLITTFGIGGALNKVEQLFDEYMRRRKDLTPVDGKITPPIKLLSALMVSHLRQGNHDKVAQLWETALPKAIQLARQIDLPTTLESPPPAPNISSMLLSAKNLTEENKILPSQRFMLAIPFKHYMSSLGAQGLYNEIAATISYLEKVGFALSSKNWNGYIQALSSSPDPSDQLSAFVLAESLLMPNFPSHWRMMTEGFGTDPFRRKEWWTNKREKRVDERYYPGHLQPTYLTMVYLGAAFIKFRDRSTIDGGVELAKLREKAPQTTEALAVMPRMKDSPQAILLRGGRPLENMNLPPRGGLPAEYFVTRKLTPRPVVHTPLGRRRRIRRRPREQSKHGTEDIPPEVLSAIEPESAWKPLMQSEHGPEDIPPESPSTMEPTSPWKPLTEPESRTEGVPIRYPIYR